MVLQSSFATASTVELRKPCNVDLETATKVNTWTNHNVIFRSDQEGWGVRDYWQTPRETKQTLHGDCEDYAIFKYYTLISWGIDPEELQIWYGRVWSSAHMVVTYCGMVLDNLTDQILPLSQSNFQPIFRVDGTNLTRWTNLITRIK
jgi:predicted transglutaminase-like cysteine proteinase